MAFTFKARASTGLAKLILALLAIATLAAPQTRDPCREGYCKEQTFHVTSVEAKDILDTSEGDACRLGMCSGTHYDVSGYIQEPGKNAVLYRAWCNDITWTAGQNKGQHNGCTQVQVGESYRARVFPTTIDFSLGKNIWQYTISSQRKAARK